MKLTEEEFLINHKKWGEGKVLSIDGDIVTVAFTNSSARRLSMAICITLILLE